MYHLKMRETHSFSSATVTFSGRLTNSRAASSSCSSVHSHGRNTGQDTDLEAINSLRATANLYRAAADQLADVQSLDEPYFAQVDLRLSRPFGFRESRGSAEVFLQIINLLDRENAGLIEGRAISQQFGQPVTLAGPPRILEMGLRIGY